MDHTHNYRSSSNLQSHDTKKTRHAFKQLLTVLRVIGIYSPPYRNKKWQTLHGVYCCIVVLYNFYMAARQPFLIMFDLTITPELKWQWFFVSGSVFSLYVTKNWNYRKTEIVVQNCNSIMENDDITAKVNRRIYWVCYSIGGILILYMILVMTLTIISYSSGLMATRTYGVFMGRMNGPQPGALLLVK